MSLLETLVVLTLVGITLGFALPHWQSFYHRQTNQHYLANLLQLIQKARHTAILRHQTLTLCPMADLKTCGKDWQKGQVVYDSTSTPLFQQGIQAPKPLIFKGFPDGSRIVISPSGYLLRGNGRFTLCGLKHMDSIIISQFGRTRTEHKEHAC